MAENETTKEKNYSNSFLSPTVKVQKNGIHMITFLAGLA